MRKVETNAHKDVVDGSLTEFGAELPKQLVMALKEVKLHIWVDSEGKGRLATNNIPVARRIEERAYGEEKKF